MNAKNSSGQFLIPSQNLFDPNQISALGYDALLQCPASKFSADQVNGNVDYVFSAKDRLAAKYYFQVTVDKALATDQCASDSGKPLLVIGSDNPCGC